MKVLSDWNDLSRKRRPIVMALGFFDGVHRGHRKVIEETVDTARRLGGEAWVLTFATHPMRILKPGSAPPLLTSSNHKLALVRRLGVDGCLLVPFSRELAALSPELFVEQLCGGVRSLREILVGSNWRFGRRGAGDVGLLRKLAGKHGVAVTAVRPVMRRGAAISSTRIRNEVAHGNLAEAGRMLGRPFSVLGTVARGRTMGRRLGFRTANLDPHNEVLPPIGVYAVKAALDACARKAAGTGNRPCDGVVNLGVRPTFGGDAPRQIELHLIDLNADLYGSDIEVFFVQRLRNERRFFSVKELSGQISRDVSNAREVLAKKRKESLYTLSATVL